MALLGVVVAGGTTALSVVVEDDGTPSAENDPAGQPHRIPWTNAKGNQASAVSCSPAGVEVSLGRSGVWHGNSTQGVDITNVGDAVCRLDGVPAVALSSPSGETVPVDSTDVGDTALTLAPGDTADVMVGVPGCPTWRSAVADELSIRLPASAEAIRFQGISLTLACGEPQVMLFENWGCTDGPCGPLGRVEAAIDAPAVASPGDVLDYTVTLTNPTDSDIRLEAYCPTYSESVVDAQTHGKRFSNDADYRLNCAAAPVIAAHDSVAFAMRMQVPQNAREAAILGWSLSDRDSVSTSTQVEITEG